MSRKTGNLYSASDKAFYDALSAKKVSKKNLEDIFIRKGVIHSRESSREYVSLHLSRMFQDYFDFELISERLSTLSRREKSSSIVIPSNISEEILEAAITALVDKRQKDKDDDEIAHKSINKSHTIDIQYSTYDFNKSEFKQRVVKDASINVEMISGGVVIRGEANDYVGRVVEGILDELSTLQEGIFAETISLNGIADNSKKVEFFEKLVRGIDGFEFYDVTDVAIHHSETGENKDLSKVFIRKASLVGGGIFSTGELKDFYKKGFYVYKVSWSMKKLDSNSDDLFCFHAQFDAPETCEGFSYGIKGIKARIDPAVDVYRTGYTPIKRFDEIALLRKLEHAAFSAKNEIIKSISVRDRNDKGEVISIENGVLAKSTS